MAIHIDIFFETGNSYAQIGQILLSVSTSMAHDGHSFFFMAIKLIKFNQKTSVASYVTVLLMNWVISKKNQIWCSDLYSDNENNLSAEAGDEAVVLKSIIGDSKLKMVF